MVHTWVLASSNQAKVDEMQRLLSDFDICLVSQSALGVGSCEEPFDTFFENALCKARHASRQTGLPALADDSGLVVDALKGAPGVRSARFFADAVKGDCPGIARVSVPEAPEALMGFDSKAVSTDEANWRLLLACLEAIPEENRGAHFVSVIVFVRFAHDPMPIIASGVWSGRIALAPAGTHGFGYDCVFQDMVTGKTAAELSAAQKDQVSHRGLAMGQFRKLYQHAYG